ncbi:MAG TPA: hypothetical protein VLT86_04290 [Vicinamibacterales bacterium]|nr:hypothetical protein [Vicinamibacterales bacterium]
MTTLMNVAAPATTVLLLVAVGADLTVADFARVARQPLVVLAGLLGPLILLPPLAVALARTFAAPADVTAGILLIAVCPIGGISNAYSYLAKASPALSVSLTGLSCACAGATIPLVSKAIEVGLSETLGFSAPARVLIAQLASMLALPVALGMWLRWRVPAWAARVRPLFEGGALAGIGIVLVLTVVSDTSAFARGFAATVPLAASFVIASLGVGWLTAACVTRDRRDRFTLAAEFGTRNVAVAIAVAVTILGRVEFQRFAVTYALTEVPLLLAAVGVYRRLQAG